MTTAPELTELDARSIAARYGGLAEYAWAVHNYTVEPYQLAWFEALQTLDRVAIICPPDTYKSTTVQFLIEQLIGLDRNSRTLWLMATASQAEKRVLAIKQTIEQNPVYQRAFGVRRNPYSKWTSTELFVERDYVSPDPTLMATGFLGAYQGLHFGRIIIDDPTDQDDARSPTVMEGQRQRLRGVLTDRLTAGGQIVAIFTRWGDADLLETYRDMGFTLIQMPVMGDYPWGKTISPKRFPEERMSELRRDKGDTLFNLTYMCDASALSGQLIKRDHLRYWDAATIPENPLAVFMYVDPAASTRTTADYAAISTVGYDYRTRQIYQLGLWTGRVGVPELRDEIVRQAQRTVGLIALGLETVGFQLGLFQDLKRQHNLPLVEVPYRTRRSVQARTLGLDKDKTGRALYLDQLFTSNRLFLAKGIPLIDGVSQESMLMTYGSATNTLHDDPPDALAGACVLAEASVPPNLKVSIKAGF